MGPRAARESRKPILPGRILPQEVGTEEAARGLGKRRWRDMEHLSLPMGNSLCLVAKAVREKRSVRTDSGCGSKAAGPPEGLCGSHPPPLGAVPLVVHGEARGAS